MREAFGRRAEEGKAMKLKPWHWIALGVATILGSLWATSLCAWAFARSWAETPIYATGVVVLVAGFGLVLHGGVKADRA